MDVSRRRILGLAGGLIATPAIVTFANLMPVSGRNLVSAWSHAWTPAEGIIHDGPCLDMAFESRMVILDEPERGPTKALMGTVLYRSAADGLWREARQLLAPDESGILRGLAFHDAILSAGRGAGATF
jgi:hypothetical protein